MRFGVEDGTTNLGAELPSLTVADQAAVATETKLAELAASVAIETWPERVAVAGVQVLVDAADASPVGRVLRAGAPAALADRWYLARVTALPQGFVSYQRLDDGTVGVRFRPGSAPRIREVQTCAKAGTGAKLLLYPSEPVRAERPIAEIVTVTQGGAVVPFSVNSVAQSDIELVCESLAAGKAQVRVGPGLVAETGLPLAPGAWTIDAGFAGTEACRELRPPP